MRPLEVHDIVELKLDYEKIYPDGVLSSNPRNNQSQMGSVITIQDGQAEVENMGRTSWYPLNVLRIFNPENNNGNIPNGGRRRRQSKRRKSKKRRYSRRR